MMCGMVGRRAALAATLLWCAALGAARAAAQPTEARCAEVRGSVLPTEDELAFAAIPWHTTLSSAALEADREGRPVLLWAMNGHPLGAT
jgi:hypothetical protein